MGDIFDNISGGGSTKDILNSAIPPPPGMTQPAPAPTGGGQMPSLQDILKMRAMRRMALEDQAVRMTIQQDAEKRKILQGQVQQGYALDAAHRKAASEPLPPTYVPQRTELPTPPRFAPRSSDLAMAQPLSLLAAIGGLFARRAGTASIRAMTAAMKGLAEGDRERYEAATKEYDEQFKRAVEYNREEKEKYTEAWDNRNKTLNERQALLQMLATKYGNEAMLRAINSGSAETITKILGLMDGTDKAIAQAMKATEGAAGHKMDAAKSEVFEKRKAELIAKGMPEGEAGIKAMNETEAKMSVEDRKDVETHKSQLRKDLQEMIQGGRFNAEEQKHANRLIELETKADLTRAEHKELATLKEELAEKLEQKKHEDKLEEQEKRAREFRSLAQAEADDVRNRRDRIMAEAKTKGESIDPGQALGRALDELRREKLHARKEGWAFLTPSVQNAIEQGWGKDSDVANWWKTESYTMDRPAVRRLTAGIETIQVGENMADFASKHPRALGVLAKIYTTMNIEPWTHFKINYGKDMIDFGAVRDQTDAAAAETERRIKALAGTRLPDGTVVTQSDANDAAIANKMLFNMALTDAANNSANGQGGTVFLDRQFQQLYSNLQSPMAILRLLHARQEEANDRWKVQDPRLDWHKRKDTENFKFFEASRGAEIGPKYIEAIMFHQFDNITGQELQGALAKTPNNQLTPAARYAVQLRDQIRTQKQLVEYLQGVKEKVDAGQAPPAQFELAKQAARILAQQVFEAE